MPGVPAKPTDPVTVPPAETGVASGERSANFALEVPSAPKTVSAPSTASGRGSGAVAGAEDGGETTAPGIAPNQPRKGVRSPPGSASRPPASMPTRARGFRIRT